MRRSGYEITAEVKINKMAEKTEVVQTCVKKKRKTKTSYTYTGFRNTAKC